MADLLIHNARIRTMDPTRPTAAWCLIRDGVICALGDGAAHDADDRIDAGGRLILPAFQDAHIHLLSGGIDIATAAMLYEVETEAALLATVADHARAKPDLPLVIGSGWRSQPDRRPAGPGDREPASDPV